MGRIFVAAIIIVFFLLNCFTPYTADDYRGKLIVGTTVHPVTEFETLGPVSSIRDVIVSARNFYFLWGGRFFAIFLTQFSLCVDKVFFNIVNTIIYTAFVFLICFHITGSIKQIKYSLFILINAILWFFIPVWGQNFLWISGTCTYLWTSTFVLFFLLPFRLRCDCPTFHLNLPLSLLFIFAGILAGCSVENSAAGIIFFLISYFVLKKIRHNKLTYFEILGCIGFFLGFVILVLAPGNYERLSLMKTLNDTEPFLLKLTRRFIPLSMLFFQHIFPFFSISIIIFYYIFQKEKRLKSLSVCYFFASAATLYSMILTPFFPPRAIMMGIVLSCVNFLYLFFQMDIKITFPYEKVVYLAYIFLFLFCINSILIAGKNTFGIYQKWQKRDKYILTERETGNLNISVKAPIPAEDRHTALYGLDDLHMNTTESWLNRPIAQYYRINSIQGVITQDPW
jgi:hypothetical protein